MVLYGVKDVRYNLSEVGYRMISVAKDYNVFLWIWIPGIINCSFTARVWMGLTVSDNCMDLTESATAGCYHMNLFFKWCVHYCQ